MLEAIRAFMNTPAADANLLKKSQHFKCPVCGADHSELLKYFDAIKKKDIENAKLQSSLTISPSNNNSEMNSENDSINDVVKQTSLIIENEEVISNSKQNTTTQEELQPNDSETLINETNVLSEEILTQNEEKETKIDNEEKETTIDNEESIENKSEEEIDPLEIKMLSQEEQATDIISNTKAEMLDEGINIAIYLAIFLISIIMLNYVKICAIVYFSK
ncbi:Ubiquitin-conjugating enzyme E2 J1 [Entamoeba marina]